MKKLSVLAVLIAVCALLYSCGTPSPANPYIKQGNEKFKGGDYKAAIEYYNEAVAADPKNPYAYDNMATAKEKIGDYKGAIEDWEKVIEINQSYKSKIQPLIDKARAKMK